MKTYILPGVYKKWDETMRQLSRNNIRKKNCTVALYINFQNALCYEIKFREEG
jgi:hypothetical protein